MKRVDENEDAITLSFAYYHLEIHISNQNRIENNKFPNENRHAQTTR